ncbi:MAG: sugar ABC transporter permease [Clostridiales bacterium]|nr:sugar ABC transporter permease [Clostridiales bacterium]
MALIGALMLFLAGYELICSLTNYHGMQSVFASRFVGADNYAYVFQHSSFLRSLGNTFIQGLMTILPSLALGMGITCLLNLFRNRALKAAFAGGALLLVLVPTIVWEELMKNLIINVQSMFVSIGLLRRTGLIDSFSASWALVLTNLIPMTCMIVFAGLTLSLSTGTPAWKSSLAVGFIPAMIMFLPDMRSLQLISNSMTQKNIQTTTYYIFQTGMMNMQLGRAAAAGTVCRILCILIGLPASLLLGSINKRAASLPRYREEGKGWVSEMCIALGVAFLMLIIMLCSSITSFFPIFTDKGVVSGTTNTIVIALLTALIAFVLCFLVITFSRHSRGGFAFALLALLLMMLTTFLTTSRLTMVVLGLSNTAFGVALGSLGNPIFLAVLLLLAAQRPVTWRQTFFLAGGGALLAAACSAGDYLPAYLYTNSRDLQPLSLVFHNILRSDSIMTSLDATGQFTPSEAINTTLRFFMTLIPLVIALPGVALVMGGVGGTRWDAKKATAAEEPVVLQALTELPAEPAQSFTDAAEQPAVEMPMPKEEFPQ